MNVHQAGVRSSDPEIPIAIAEEPRGCEVPDRAGERIWFDLSSHDSPDPSARPEQERSVVGFGEPFDSIARPHFGIEFWRAGFPVPHSLPQSHPEIAPMVLEQTANSIAKTAVLAVALDAAFSNGAELSRRWKRQSADPYRAFMIFTNWRTNRLSGELRVMSQLAVSPTCDSFGSANPKSSIARGEQAEKCWWKEDVGPAAAARGRP